MPKLHPPIFQNFHEPLWDWRFLLALALAAFSPWAAYSKADVDSAYGKTCIDAGCHAVEAAGRVPRHSPYLEGRCLSCHLDHKSTGTALLRARDNTLCLSCHRAMRTEPGTHRLVHPPGTNLCLDCHNPHESRVRGLLRDEKTRESCAQCHAPFLNKGASYPYRHHYFDFKTQCGACHEAHENPENHYLRPNAAETCLTCHDIPIKLGSRTLENVAERLREAPVVHGAMQKGSCPVCHTPHGSEQPSLLNQGYPAGNYERYQPDQYRLCWQCHDKALAEDPHGTKATRFRNGDENLHWRHVAGLKRGRACHLCHEAHASDTPHLIRKRLVFKQWDAPLNYKPAPDGGSCQTPCHQEKKYTR